MTQEWTPPPPPPPPEEIVAPEEEQQFELVDEPPCGSPHGGTAVEEELAAEVVLEDGLVITYWTMKSFIRDSAARCEFSSAIV